MLSLNFLLLYQLLNNDLVSYNEYNVDRAVYETAPSSNNYLSSVTFEGVNFNFEKTNTDYVINVPFSKKTLGLNYTQEDEKSQVQVIGDEELLLGNNSLVIVVSAEDGSTLEYNFTIIRMEDNSVVQDNAEAIKAALAGNEASKLFVNITKEDLMLDAGTVNLLRISKKSLVFNWNDIKGSYVSSLTVDGQNIIDAESMNLNIKNSITDTKLTSYLKEYDYIPLSFADTNIPDGSIYKMKVDEKKDLYYLYYYDGDLLVSKPVRVIDSMIEFEVKSGIDYAIVLEKPNALIEDANNYHWVWITLFIIILFLVFFIITKYTALKYVQTSHHEKNKKKM